MKKEIVELREKMKEAGVDIYVIPTGDFHGSEYLNDYFKTRRFVSGFTGSAGTLVVTQEEARLWVDSRYYIQGEMETEGTGITLMKMGLDGVPEVGDYLESVLSPGMVLGFDGRIETGTSGKTLETLASEKDASIIFDIDLVGEIWEERPELKSSTIWKLPDESSGKTFGEKIKIVREKMAELSADYYLAADLMENAYLYNLRGGDVTHTPVFFSYSLISKDGVTLYSFHASEETRALILGDQGESADENLSLKGYFDILKDIKSIPAGASVLMDPETVSYALIKSVPQECRVILESSPLSYMKAIKNPSEIASTKKAHIIDGIAMARFICWLKKRMALAIESGASESSETEISASDYLYDLRAEGEGFIDLSFGTISGYGPHGAIVHYGATPETNVHLEPHGFLLVDSGAQYLSGTTDITRTIALGPLSQEMKRAYTAVLKGHIALALAHFPEGTKGDTLDKLVRDELEPYGYSYGHGTGHGVGHVLGVHEGPQTISTRGTKVAIAPGMVVSNEPGYYPEGEFGVRIENLILCVDDWAASSSSASQASEKTLRFENLTLCPYEKEAILKEELTSEEIEYINQYHKLVAETICPLLKDEETKAWLEDTCRPL